MNVIFRTLDHPECNGRKPQIGEQEYTLRFPTEDGKIIIIKMGQKGFDIVTNHLMDMLSNTPSHTDEKQ